MPQYIGLCKVICAFLLRLFGPLQVLEGYSASPPLLALGVRFRFCLGGRREQEASLATPKVHQAKSLVLTHTGKPTP